ncbi:Ig-like domain-containing protein [Dawidia soli]|uniref:Uncharacterized protein n=1 Tax=Dawidia soli TaxID=2782352 RepID=A0AAP2D960_9BACT|nr:Ig-like domain-containing protein [Dawidia soli]MBT1686771.1 hypothetical protein [Dawidia soli]
MLFPVKSIIRRSLLVAGLALAAQACDEMSGDVIPTEEEIDQAVDLDAALAVNGPVLVDLVQAAKLTGAATISIVQEPTKGTVSILSSALLMYTPNKDFTNGTDQVIYSVCAGGNCDEGTIDFTYVSDETKCYSMAVPDLGYGKPTDPQIIVDVLENDILCDDQFDVSTLKVVSQPTAGEAKIIDGLLFYYPVTDYAGPIYIVYSVAGRANPNTLYYGMASISVQPEVITLQAVNDAFHYTAAEYAALLEASPGNQITYPLSAIFGNDQIGNLTYIELDVEIVDAPAHGTARYEQNEVFRYTPAEGYRGSDSFVYKICYDGQCSQATVSIDVAETQPLRAVADEIVYTHAQYLDMIGTYGALNIPIDNIFGNDVLNDVPVSQLQVTTPQQPYSGSIQYFSLEMFKFTPNNHFDGSESFIYMICHDGQCSETEVTITVTDWPQ